MIVTNEDLQFLDDLLGDLTCQLLRKPDYDTSLKLTRQKTQLCALKQRLLKEFTDREFPEMKEPH